MWLKNNNNIPAIWEVYSAYLWWFGGWFIIVWTTLVWNCSNISNGQQICVWTQVWTCRVYIPMTVDGIDTGDTGEVMWYAKIGWLKISTSWFPAKPVWSTPIIARCASQHVVEYWYLKSCLDMGCYRDTFFFVGFIVLSWVVTYIYIVSSIILHDFVGCIPYIPMLDLLQAAFRAAGLPEIIASSHRVGRWRWINRRHSKDISKEPLQLSKTAHVSQDIPRKWWNLWWIAVDASENGSRWKKDHSGTVVIDSGWHFSTYDTIIR